MRLTAAGQEAQWEYADRIAAVEDGAARRFGAGAVAALRAELERQLTAPGPAPRRIFVRSGAGRRRTPR